MEKVASEILAFSELPYTLPLELQAAGPGCLLQSVHRSPAAAALSNADVPAYLTLWDSRQDGTLCGADGWARLKLR